MRAQYGANTLSRTTAYEWIEMFKNGRMNVTDAERSDRRPTIDTTAHFSSFAAMFTAS
jgi:hypothetical protein